mmetsp:Transcript_19729/g.55746  ORF Transcript_19729/g.55746 Transcript_19729/m.55746 type:complete len:213 (+) Transcript_19729:1434-2072(+)
MWSQAIGDSFRRATTYSFGSVCMASLLVALVRALEAMVSRARRHGRGNQMLMCIIECLLSLIASVAEYFTKWAIVYVGLFGYDYLTAGRKVMELFRERGWSAIISDNLAARVMALGCVVIGAATGLCGVLLNQITGWANPSLGEGANIFVFIICTIIGLSISTITMSVVMSAVDTVIVSFAEAPQEFESNHPRLSQQMRSAWRSVYPDECGF